VIDFKSASGDILVGIIDPVFQRGPAADSLNHCLLVIADEVQQQFDVDVLFEHLALVHVARDAVEDQQVVFRIETAGGPLCFEPVQEYTNRDVIRGQLPASAVFPDDLAVGGMGIQLPKNNAAGKVIKPGNDRQDVPLCSFPRSGNAED